MLMLVFNFDVTPDTLMMHHSTGSVELMRLTSFE